MITFHFIDKDDEFDFDGYIATVVGDHIHCFVPVGGRIGQAETWLREYLANEAFSGAQVTPPPKTAKVIDIEQFRVQHAPAQRLPSTSQLLAIDI